VHAGHAQHRHPGPLRRLWLSLRSDSLDDRILAREPAAGSRELADREEVLLDRGKRRKLARSLERLAGEVAKPAPRLWLNPRLPLRRREIREAGPDLHALAHALCEEREVSARGVILASRLIQDGGSPIYALADPLFGSGPRGRLPVDVAVRHARTALLMG
jgi:hypothetical protein